MADTSSNGDGKIELPAAFRVEWMRDGLRLRFILQRRDGSEIQHDGKFMVYAERNRAMLDGNAERYFVNRVEDSDRWKTIMQKRAAARRVA